ncbi:Type-1 restriction enzyme EcoKI specificity protein [bioreactor metagenome]|uniref:Type-1 restriction enzyme EcoKI specificity protein n=1 Tax=bioreactor metagenome TaxID=1076179 RepID=A0A644W7B6_9ZZZZ
MTAQDLKNSILQLAMQGKLVPQDPNDDPAIELLKRIKAEKTLLIKEGKIKKQKSPTPITEEEKPFEIPENWIWCRVSDIVLQNLGGGTPAKNVPEYWGGDIPWASVKDLPMADFWLNETQDAITRSGLNKSSSNFILKDNIIICTRMGLGKVVINTIDVAINQDLRALMVSQYIFKMFLIHFFKSSRLVGKGQTVKGVTIDVLENMLLPLPPFEEQKRIVAKIEELLPLIERYDESEKRLLELNRKFPDELRKSILQQAVQGKLTEQDPHDEPASELLKRIMVEKARLIKEGKIKKEKPLPHISEEEIPFDIPEGWEFARIGLLCSNFQYGTSRKSSKSGKVAVLRMGNLQSGRIDYRNLVYTSNEEDLSKYKLNEGDILFNRTNSRELVGKTAIYKAEYPAIFAGYLVRLTPIEIDNDYLNLVMQSGFFKQFCMSVKTDAIGQSNINAEKLKAFICPVPPFAEQRRIVAKAEVLLSVCDSLK